MERFDYHIRDNYKARHIYKNAVFYAKMANNKRVEFISFSADKINHCWEEYVIKIYGNKIRLHLNIPYENGERKFGEETLGVEFFGDDKAKKLSKGELEGLTGIRINED